MNWVFWWDVFCLNDSGASSYPWLLCVFYPAGAMRWPTVYLNYLSTVPCLSSGSSRGGWGRPRPPQAQQLGESNWNHLQDQCAWKEHGWFGHRHSPGNGYSVFHTCPYCCINVFFVVTCNCDFNVPSIAQVLQMEFARPHTNPMAGFLTFGSHLLKNMCWGLSWIPSDFTLFPTTFQMYIKRPLLFFFFYTAASWVSCVGSFLKVLICLSCVGESIFIIRLFYYQGPLISRKLVCWRAWNSFLWHIVIMIVRFTSHRSCDGLIFLSWFSGEIGLF